ncbi:uncharacterized protein BDV14DRAFT_173356 [Aspergillus stella-maris]|uniref:uncharacterized protein n=1 Tax=Aspergillus stella-maris TaxID=1810926 RepID=UPI003CCE2FC8
MKARSSASHLRSPESKALYTLADAFFALSAKSFLWLFRVLTVTTLPLLCLSFHRLLVIFFLSLIFCFSSSVLRSHKACSSSLRLPGLFLRCLS